MNFFPFFSPSPFLPKSCPTSRTSRGKKKRNISLETLVLNLSRETRAPSRKASLCFPLYSSLVSKPLTCADGLNVLRNRRTFLLLPRPFISNEVWSRGETDLKVPTSEIYGDSRGSEREERKRQKAEGERRGRGRERRMMKDWERKITESF